MDQGLIAGIGNIYADEILFQARLHPKTPMTALDERQRAELFEQIKAVLKTAIARGAGAEAVPRAPARRLSPAAARQGRQVPALRQRARDPQGRRPHLLLLPALPAGA